MSDRITELESTVSRLESNIEGLRDQLVEANDRIRQLERDLAAELVDEEAAHRLNDEATVEGDAIEDEGTETEESPEDIIIA